MYWYKMNSPIGVLTLTENNNYVSSLYFANESPAKLPGLECKTPLLEETVNQLEAYFSGKLKKFDLPMHQTGTEFMQKTWNALREIPYGETRSYKDIAEAIGHPNAYRAVGMANHRNNLPLFIPCHRVIAANGTLGGFGGGLGVKNQLLQMEKKFCGK